MLQNFRSYQLSVRFYKSCQQLKLPYYLKDQILRASSSVALNLSEGSAKTSTREQKRFYGIALASLRECQTVLELLDISDQVERELHNLNKQADCLGAHIFRLIESRQTSPK